MDKSIAAIAELHQLFSELIKILVDDPDSVIVEIDANGENTVLHAYVARRDLGKIIGKEGRTAKSLRLLLASASMKYDKRFELFIHEAVR